MKKVFLLSLCLLLTGCFENSGYLVKSCTKEEVIDDFSSKETYTFGFKNDVIDDLKLVYDYNASDVNTISSIKLSMEGQNNAYRNQISYNVLVDTANQYKIEYNLPLEADKTIIDKFNIRKSRTDLVRLLEEKGFDCEWKKSIN